MKQLGMEENPIFLKEEIYILKEGVICMIGEKRRHYKWKNNLQSHRDTSKDKIRYNVMEMGFG